jgi:hypothetical protein
VTIEHLSTPKVDDLTIEPVERNLAPFTSREKPQLSPCLAASLVKSGPQISGLHANRERSLGCNGKLGTTIAGRVMPIFIGFLQ